MQAPLNSLRKLAKSWTKWRHLILSMYQAPLRSMPGQWSDNEGSNFTVGRHLQLEAKRN